MLCPICQKNELVGRQTYCSPACRKKASRQLAKDLPTIPATEKLPTTIIYPPSAETPEEWLARRVKETGSKKWQWIKTGNPPGSQPDIKVPQKWELSDIDKSKEYRGQWGERDN